ncbi:SubName: Full=Uncharacterized protein {ECO:0000313/EMBL:CCA74295.1} [Serendipita indica DSM 11827]|nr:SubName: Full=Uncharacterized protein {ECO:0000313/EMBL:CCA74295.1} [Serendipita indica DSM 11827]
MSKQFYVQLTHGIQGGIMPPNPTSIQTLTSAPENGQPSLLFKQTKRSHDQPKLPDEPTIQSTAAVSKISQIDGLIAELEGILKKLPTENPPGGKDIYGLDIGLMYGSDNVEWMNAAPSGCGGGFSEVEPTPEQIEQFKRAVAIVEEIGNLSQ